jgi:hypothetical protein
MQSNSEAFGAVKITFNVGENPAQFHRDPFFGLANLVIALAWQRRRWTVSHGGHTVEIDKVRPRWFGGLRPNSYTVKVDGAEVATSRGF